MIYFKEEQRLNQWWLILIVCLSLAGIVITFGYAFYQQLYLGEPWGNKPIPDNMLLIAGLSSFALTFAIGWGLFTARLEVQIKDRAIYYRFKPFFWSTKKISVNEIDRFEVRRYKAIHEYGGIGYRYSFKHGRAMIVKGHTGLQLYLNNGKKLLLGTQKSQEIKSTMTRMMELKKENNG